jgi:hypothetical protein
VAADAGGLTVWVAKVVGCVEVEGVVLHVLPLGSERHDDCKEGDCDVM